MLLQIITFVLFGTAFGNKYTCSNNPVTNGCNVYSWVPYKEIFTPDCHRHDVCYACGAAHGLSKESCDNTFHDDMLETCNTDDRAGWFCEFWAKTYYLGVDIFGDSYYHDDPMEWCSNGDWYMSCLDFDK